MFVDTGAWIALALTRDPLHVRAVDAWAQISTKGARLHTSVPVMLETFTFLDRHARRDVALAWKDSLGQPRGASLAPVSTAGRTANPRDRRLPHRGARRDPRAGTADPGPRVLPTPLRDASGRGA